MTKQYENPKKIRYYSLRYKKWITVPKKYLSNGADYVLDICPKSWFVHDWICGNYLGRGPKPIGGVWDDGTPMTNWQCSHVFTDIIAEEGRKLTEAPLVARLGHTYVLPVTRFWGTWLFGGGKARENGMIWL
jgi:hypothetical protein